MRQITIVIHAAEVRSILANKSVILTAITTFSNPPLLVKCKAHWLAGSTPQT